MTVSVDGTSILNTTVAATSWTTYTTTGTVASGSHTVAVAFTNAYSVFGCARTLMLDSVTLVGGSPAPTPPGTRALVGGCGGGELLWLSDADLSQELNLASAAGVRYIRVDVNWSEIEPIRGQRNWANVDRVVNAVVARGMQPLGLVLHTPAWARAYAATGEEGAPKDPAQFAAFAKDAATRYLSRVASWEVWNEPNIGWKPAPNVTAYAALLKATYTAIKSVSPNLFVISGGLAPATDSGGEIAPVTFIKGLYSARANAYFDAFGMHPYTFPYLPTDPNPWSAFGQMWQMRDVMVSGGDSAKRIWLTEFGAPTGTDTTSVTEAVQAQSISSALQSVQNTSWMGPMFVYSLRDRGTNRSSPEDNFGLVHRDFSAKPAYAVVKNFATGT